MAIKLPVEGWSAEQIITAEKRAQEIGSAQCARVAAARAARREALRIEGWLRYLEAAGVEGVCDYAHNGRS